MLLGTNICIKISDTFSDKKFPSKEPPKTASCNKEKQIQVANYGSCVPSFWRVTVLSSLMGFKALSILRFLGFINAFD